MTKAGLRKRIEIAHTRHLGRARHEIATTLILEVERTPGQAARLLHLAEHLRRHGAPAGLGAGEVDLLLAAALLSSPRGTCQLDRDEVGELLGISGEALAARLRRLQKAKIDRQPLLSECQGHLVLHPLLLGIGEVRKASAG